MSATAARMVDSWTPVAAPHTTAPIHTGSAVDHRRDQQRTEQRAGLVERLVL